MIHSSSFSHWMKANGLTVVQGVGKSKIRPRTQSPHIDFGTTEKCGIIFLRIPLNNLKHPSQGHFPTTPHLPPTRKHMPWADAEGDFVYWPQPGSRKRHPDCCRSAASLLRQSLLSWICLPNSCVLKWSFSRRGPISKPYNIFIALKEWNKCLLLITTFTVPFSLL